MAKRLRVSLSVKGIEQYKKEVQNYEQWFEAKKTEFFKRIADRARHLTEEKFISAEYDGTNDVAVRIEPTTGNSFKVIAEGQTVLFIEFGTGVVYPDSHPEKPDGILGRGQYGKGRGKYNSWTYYGDPGTNGKIIRETPKGIVVRTSGNPANMCMYEMRKQLIDEIPQIAREVFKR